MLSPRLLVNLFKSHNKPLVGVNFVRNQTSALQFNAEFSDAEQARILSIVNDGSAEELSKFDVSRSRIKSLEDWRTKNGPFRCLSDILEVDGLSEKVLERLCRSIIQKHASESKPPSFAISRKQFSTPKIDSATLNNMETVVGMHTSSTGFSWALMSRQNNAIDAWNFHDFTTLPKIVLPNETFDLAVHILGQLPSADVYVFESSKSSSAGSKKTVVTHNPQLELAAMLLAMINCNAFGRHRQHDEEEDDQSMVTNKVYYLRAYLAARLFKTIVGNERVSSNTLIAQLLTDNANLPFTPPIFSEDIKRQYHRQTAVHKDLLGQALMIVVAFMQVCVYKTPKCLQQVAQGRRI